MKKENLHDVVVLGGGIIPEEDVPGLLQMGFAAIYGPGTRTDTIIKTIHEEVMKRRAA
jgi:methylmalonyl-CoA mutase C-terminal domain/subunit